jgi:hypothetical protein
MKTLGYIALFIVAVVVGVGGIGHALTSVAQSPSPSATTTPTPDSVASVPAHRGVPNTPVTATEPPGRRPVIHGPAPQQQLHRVPPKLPKAATMVAGSTPIPGATPPPGAATPSQRPPRVPPRPTPPIP